ncbi:MAG: DUF2148 domain-containing protein [Candidatus Natronoplasma sp.]
MEEKKAKVSSLISDLMKISAESSPKATEDFLTVVVLDGGEIEILAEEMFQLSDEFDDESYSEEGEFIESSDEVILVGLEDHPPLDIDCRACGYESCDDFSEAEETEDIFKGPNCIFRVLDLGMALGNAANTSEMHHLDPTLSIRGGLAAKHLGLIDSRVCLAVTANHTKEKNYYKP